MINLLPIAMQATSILGCNKEFEYYPPTSTTINSIGVEIPSEVEPLVYTGSIQAVENKLYSQLNLDLTKNYKTVFCPELLETLAEETTPGQIKYNGKMYDIISNQNWWETNGYTQCIICEIKALNNDY